MHFLYGVALLVAALLLFDLAVGAANARILRSRFLDEAVPLVITSMIGFGVLFLFFGYAMHRDCLHAIELGLSIAAILLSIRGVRRAILRLFRGKTPDGPAAAH